MLPVRRKQKKLPMRQSVGENYQTYQTMPRPVRSSHAVGKRKSSVARVWLKEGQGSIVINGRPHVDYFRQIDYRMSVLQPFFETATLGHFDISCRVHGGGLSGDCSVCATLLRSDGL